MEGRSIVDIFPVLVFCALNAYIWVPIAWQAWVERQPRERNGGRFPLGLRRAQA
jgi:hypothetical protein